MLRNKLLNEKQFFDAMVCYEKTFALFYQQHIICIA